jgi:[ribosomal protein S18]-alanine N-acetyltransferase
MSAEIVRAGIADLPAIMPVMNGAFPVVFGEAWTQAQCLGVMSMPGSELIIARDEIAIGFALSRAVVDESELMLLAVAPASQHHGVGRQLLKTMIANARASGVRSVFLEVRQGNPAVSLYTSLGFCEVGRRRGYYRGPTGQIFDALSYRLVMS